MPLRWTTIDLPWAGGLDDKRHPYLRELPKAETLINLRFQQSGAWSARDGYTNLGGPAQVPYALAGWSDTMLNANAAGVWRLDQPSGQWPSGQWRELQTPGPRAVDVARNPIVRNERGCRVAVSAAQAGHVAHFWSRTFETDGDVWCRVDNAETGAVVYGPVVLAGITTAVTGVAVSAPSDRAVLQAVSHENGYVSVFARDAVGGTLASSITLLITTAGGVTVGSATAHTGVGETLLVDAVQNNTIVVGAAATNRLHRFVRSGLALVLESTCVASGLGSILGVCYASNGSRVIALGLDGTDIMYATASVASSLPGTATPGVAWTLLSTDEQPYLAVGVELTADAEGMFFVQSNPATAPQQLRLVGFDDAGDCHSGASWVQWHLGIAAWPWRSAEGVGVIPLTAPLVPEADGTSATAFRRTGILAEFNYANAGAANAFLRRIGVFGLDYLRQMETRRRSHSYIATTGGPRIFGGITETLLGAGDTRFEALIATYQCDWWTVAEEKPATWRGESNGAALLASGLLATVDGIRHAEQMQMPPPVMQTVLAYSWSPGNGSGAFPGLEVATGTWAFRACWMWRDNLGNVHRSAPSEAIERTMEVDGPPTGSTNAIQSVRVAVPPFAEWRRDGGTDAILPTDVYLEFYTSPRAPILPPTNTVAVNDLYERIAHGLGYSGTALVAPPLLTSERRISPLVDIIDPTDPAWTVPLFIPGGATGTAASVNDYFDVPLYTNGGVLDNDPTPCPLHCASTRDRVWMIDSEDRFSVWYSKPIQPAVGVEFSALLTLRVPTEAGELVALGAVDDLVLLMSESSIFGIDTADNGPDSTGNGDFPPLRRISREVGCVNAASVITTDVGCFFASAAGIYVVQATGQLTWVGRDLGDDVDVSSITSAHVVPERKEVVFTTSNGLLVYDYDHGQWTQVAWTATDRPTAGGATLVSSVVYGGETVVVATDGRAWQENATSQESVIYQARTGWIHLAGLQSFQRVRRFGLLGRILFDPTPTPPFEIPPQFGTLAVRVYYDFDETSFDDYSITLADVRTRLDPMRLRWHLRRQKCQSLAFRITYLPPSGGQGTFFYGRPEFVGLALEVGTKARLAPWAQALGAPRSE